MVWSTKTNEEEPKEAQNPLIEKDLELEMLIAQIADMVPADIAIDDKVSVSAPSSSTSKNSQFVAAISFVLGIGGFFFTHNQPANSVALLKAMEKDSPTLSSAFCNGKPTIVDFYADWCESCKAMAPSMRALELKYSDSLNFVTLDGTNPRYGNVVGAFRVDAIPHVAFVTPSLEVKTALVGAVPKKILEQNMEALSKVSLS